MSKKREGNIKLATAFIFLVFCLIILSMLYKFFVTLRESKFDGAHKFVVAFVGRQTTVVSFSPQTNSISSLKIDTRVNPVGISGFLEAPIDGMIFINKNSISDRDIPGILFTSSVPFGNKLSGITEIDAFRLFLFSKAVPSTSIYDRELSSGLNDAQTSAIISLTFNDPTIVQENKSIQIINAANAYGLGSRLATFIANIGGNVILVTTANNISNSSKIIYSGKKTYTVEKLSEYLGMPLIKSGQQGLSDVTIVIGTDKINSKNF